MTEKSNEASIRTVLGNKLVHLLGHGSSAAAADPNTKSYIDELIETIRSTTAVLRPSVELEKHLAALKPPAQRQHSATARNRVYELEQERNQLRLENELLQSRVAEARRTASREVQRYDQLLREYCKLQTQNGQLLNCLRGRCHAVDTAVSLLVKQQNTQLRMIERYEGVVEHIHDDSVTVVFEIDDDIVEHNYNRNQFIDGQLSEIGDRFTVFVHVVHGAVAAEDDSNSETDEWDEHEELEGNKITGPMEF